MEQERTASGKGRPTGGTRHSLKIIISENNRGQGAESKAFVKPGHCHVKPSDNVTWTTRESGITLLFPDRDLFGTREVKIKSGDSKTLTVDGDAKKGRYPYAIYCDEANCFAEGGSFPIMIVE